ncbi:MAG: ribonuclease P protein component [Myxococcales bacterium]|nr:ribonuclease P protein component [Myxococcales bacterium]
MATPVSATAQPESLPRAHRLRQRRDYLRVQRQGRRVHTPHFILVVQPDAAPRLGVTVTRRVAGAVGRNRIKRLAREVFRRNRCSFPRGCTVVFVARRGADKLNYHEVLSELRDAKQALHAAAGPGPRTTRGPRSRRGQAAEP